MKPIAKFFRDTLSETQFGFLLAFIGLLMGIFAIKAVGPHFLSPDSTGYHNYAINIAERGVYSTDSAPPYRVYYMREPGYPAFLALLYKVYDVWGEPSHIRAEDYDPETKELLEPKSEVEFAKYIQLILTLLTVFLFYKLLRMFNSAGVSRIAALAIVLYYPFMVFCTRLLREPLLALLFTVFGYFIAKYYYTRKQWYLLAATAVIAYAALTWQVMIVFTPLLLVIMLFARQNVLRSLLRTLFYALVFLLLISPWLIHVYKYYSDIRIARSLGSSLTREYLKYQTAVFTSRDLGLRPDLEDGAGRATASPLPSSEVFSRSFNGWYTSQADSIWRTLDVPQDDIKKYFAKHRLRAWKNFFIHNTWFPFIGEFKGLKPFTGTGQATDAPTIDMGFELQALLLQSISVLLALFFIVGLIVYPKRKLVYFLPYLLFCCLVQMVGSEDRRFLPIVPWQIFLAIYALNFLRNHISGWKRNRRPKKKLAKEEI